MKPRVFRSAFTLIELLVVIAIIGVLAAMVAPSLQNFRKGDALATATSQLLGGVARARQLAISQRSEVYMVFLPTNFWGEVMGAPAATLPEATKVAITNLIERQLTGYNFFTFRSVGDQPGQGIGRYLGEWQKLPDGVFIPEAKFNPRTALPVLTINDAGKQEQFLVYGFTNVLVPFPFENSATFIKLPCISFDYQGRLARPLVNNFELIPLAEGSLLYPRNPQTRKTEIGNVDVQERPPGNSTNGYNLVRIDWLTGRGHLERREIQ
jgi:prepilin-type N-terminal cleavage/methylation domain-containing protein